MKKVLISQRLVENLSYPEQRECLDIRWGSFLSTCSILPIPVLLNCNLQNYLELDISGIILTGGDTLSSIEANSLTSQRDALETRLLELSIIHKIPLLGVCRGMQLIGRYFQAPLEAIPGHVATSHPLYPSEGELSMFFPAGRLFNSYHSFGLPRVYEPLEPIATAADNSVEALRHRSLPIYGIMWHPERCSPFHQEDRALFDLIFR